MTEENQIVPVWFFVGLLLLIYGVLIFITGLVEWSQPSDVVLANLHSPVWWGALLTAIGALYTFTYGPWRKPS